MFVPRPVWIVEGQSSDPYYNFGKVIMYFDKEMYRIYWKMVHNRGGEYFYTAMCAYHFVKNDENFHAVFPNFVVGVNDKTNRAALGRCQESFIERKWDPAYFSLRTLTHDRLDARRAHPVSPPLSPPRERSRFLRTPRCWRAQGQVGVGLRLHLA